MPPDHRDLGDVLADVSGNSGQVFVDGLLRLTLLVPGVDAQCDHNAGDDQDNLAGGIAQVAPEFPVHEQTPLDLPEDEHHVLSPLSQV